MTADQTAASEAARVLLLHASFKASPEIQETDTPWWWECDGCSTKVAEGGTGRSDVFAGLAAHQADALAKAGLLREEATGQTSDGYHTFDELYEYRMLYNAHAAAGWLAAGIPVVKSWYHSDGEPCFGGGWFVVVVDLYPHGQVSNHYPAADWDLFHVPEVDRAPEWDGHTPQDAAQRLRASLLREAETKETGPELAVSAANVSPGAGTLGSRLRGLMLRPSLEPGTLAVALPVGELREIAAEADRLAARIEQVKAECRHLHQDGLSRHDWHAKHCGAVEGADQMRRERDVALAQVEAIRAAIEREAAHGDAITRCNLVAERFRTVLDSVPSTAASGPRSAPVGDGASDGAHPLGKVIGVVRERGTEHYKNEGDRELFVPGNFTIRAPEAGRLVFAPELQADLGEQIDQFGKRLARRIRAEMGLPETEEAP